MVLSVLLACNGSPATSLDTAVDIPTSDTDDPMGCLPAFHDHLGSTYLFPVPTHFPGAGCGEADDRTVALAYETWTAVTTDYVAPTESQVQAAVEQMADIAGGPIRFVPSLDEVEFGIPEVQVVNNEPIGQSLYTVILPADLQPTDAHPILLSAHSGAVSNNLGMYGEGDLPFAAQVGFLGPEALGGSVIVAMSNAGGRESQGVAEPVLASVGMAVDRLDLLGGDPHAVITHGFSRGGTTSLLWAENRLEDDYTVIAAFSLAGVWNFGRTLAAPVATFPGAWFDITTMFGDSDAWRVNADPGYSELQAFAQEFMVGTTNEAAGNALSAAGDLEALTGPTAPYLFLEIPTHDSKIPIDGSLSVLEALEGHPALMVNLNIRAGHDSTVVSREVLGLFLQRHFGDATVQLPTGMSATVAPRLYDGSGTPDVLVVSDTPIVLAALPFVSVFPYGMERGVAADLVLCGEPGTAYAAEGLWDGSPFVSVAGTFDASRCHVESFVSQDAEGLIAWSFFSDGQPVPISAMVGMDPSSPDDWAPATTRVWTTPSRSALSLDPNATERAFGLVLLP